MEKQILFGLLIMVTFIILYGIILIGNSIIKLVSSDIFKKKLEQIESRSKNIKSASSLLISTLSSSYLYGQGGIEYSPMFKITDHHLWILFFVNVTLIIVLFYMKNIFSKLNNIEKEEKTYVAKKKEKQAVLSKILTDRVPMENEDSILLDHNYDGIMELDNNLPPWWKWGFYLSIFIGIIYFANYHVFGISNLQEDAYKKELVQAEEKIKEYLASQAMDVDEKSVVILTGKSDLNKGRDLYQQYCSACHGKNGQGIVGPNFTDDYWIYGGSIVDVFKLIKYGGKNGMKSWKDELNPIEMQQVASYIKNLKDTNPPDQKEAQGELYVEVSLVSDSIPLE
jgi:cytochrome c oxidase cbb3-type subunit III